VGGGRVIAFEMLATWALIAGTIVAAIALYVAVGRIVDECLGYWRWWRRAAVPHCETCGAETEWPVQRCWRCTR